MTDIHGAEADVHRAIYATLRQVVADLAGKGMALILQTSRRTYLDHLDSHELAAGPWRWVIKEEVPYGDVFMYARIASDLEDLDRAEGKRIGTFTVTDRRIH